MKKIQKQVQYLQQLYGMNLDETICHFAKKYIRKYHVFQEFLLSMQMRRVHLSQYQMLVHRLQNVKKMNIFRLEHLFLIRK